MFIIDLTYIVSSEEVSQHMAEHLQHLEKYYEQNILIMWGGKVPRTGGVILALADSLEAVEKIIAEDPFHKLKVAEFKITQFTPAKYRPDLKGLLA